MPVPPTPALPAQPQYAYPPQGTDGLAVASLVLSLVWLMGLGSIAAVITGHLSRGRAKREGRPPSGLALAGLIIGYVGGLLITIPILAAIAIPVFLNQRALGNQSVIKSDLRELSVLEETYSVDNSAYSDDLSMIGYSRDDGVVVSVVSASGTSYCLEGTKNGTTLYFDSRTLSFQDSSC